MLAVFMFSGRMCLTVRCNVASVAIVPHGQGARGESICIAMRLTLRNGGSCGTGRSWRRYICGGESNNYVGGHCEGRSGEIV